MKILINKEDVLKRLIGCPTIYYTTGAAGLVNGDIVQFHYNYLDNTEYLYGQIKYDIKKEDYYIDFDMFYDQYNLQRCKNIYLSKLLCNKEKGRKIIVEITIYKCLNIEKFIELANKYNKAIEYYKELKSYLNDDEKFNALIEKMYREGYIDFLEEEIQEDKFITRDPELTIDVKYTLTGEDISTFEFVDLNKICEEVESLLEKKGSTNKSISGHIYFAETSIKICFDYQAKPIHKLIIELQKNY